MIPQMYSKAELGDEYAILTDKRDNSLHFNKSKRGKTT
jgi:hypothetical protein